MDVAMDVYLTVPLVFTVLAVIIASLYLKFRPTDTKEETITTTTTTKVDESQTAEQKPNVEGKAAATAAAAEDSTKPEEEEEEEERAEQSPQEPEKPKEKMKVEEIGAEETAVPQSEDPQKRAEQEPTPQEGKTLKAPGDQQEPSPSPSPSHPEEKPRKEEDVKVENTKTSLPADNEGLVDDALKYSPGKIRGSHYEKTLTREELEEEQRRVGLNGVSTCTSEDCLAGRGLNVLDVEPKYPYT
ncbi:matrix-remodeling-associated protein 7 isoform X2 [Callorhinchus milii]|uniref:matrix-remodeling-associated protein 7 isoform X2 n=1 Tax=Callorhinchus milii TaxID=7868 RepID=UPI000457330F|nr:matrix-remodeling-associated protein 7 isoform X2 [Callorhinchus milii]|eukprot:gi/632942970/ref/XP_007886714.1/ PREDICTED: matrix-remodeling-associated protein 7 isoform X2 [Callorhinchus milii]